MVLRALFVRHGVALGAAAWLSLAGALAALALAHVGGEALHGAIAGRARFEWLAAVAALGAARIGLAWAQGRVAIRAAHRMATELRATLIAHAIALDPRSGLLSGELTTRIAHDVTQLQAIVAFRAPTLIADTLAAMVLAGYALTLDATTVLATAAPGVLALPVILWSARRAAGHQEDARREYGGVIDAIVEVLDGALVLRQVGATDVALRSVSARLARFEENVLESRAASAVTLPLAHLAALGSVVVFALVVALRVHEQSVSSEAAVTLMATLSLCARPLTRLTSTLSEGTASLSSWIRVRDLLARPRAHRQATAARPHGEARLTLSSVGVRRGERAVLSDISFAVAPGERVAIVGANGAGKTTLTHAILGLVPHDGSVSIDTQRPDDACAWVPQDPVLFEGTILTNVALGQPVDRERAQRVLTELTSWSWVSARGGLDAPVEVGGRNLSRGQAQHLSLARALYLDRPILVLDEPTASLDPSSASAVAAALDALLRDRTALVITHDAALQRQCTRTLALGDGRLVSDAVIATETDPR